MNRRRIDRSKQLEGRTGVARAAAVGLARFFGALAIAALVIFGFVSAYGWLRTSEQFQVASIVFTGVKHADQDELARRAGLVPGVNVFTVDLASASRAMEEDPWVAHARVARELPGTLRVAIDEHVPVALVSLGGLYAVDGAGTLFKRVLAADQLDLPVITGLSREGFAGEQRGDDPALRTALGLVAAYASHRMEQRAPLSELHVEEEGGELALTAWCGDEPVEVTLGGVEGATTKELVERLDRLAKVWDELERRGARAKAIDVGNRQRPEWIAARLE